MKCRPVTIAVITSAALLLPSALQASHGKLQCPADYHCLELKLITNTPVKLLLNKSRYSFGGEVRFIPKFVKKSAVIPFYPLTHNKSPVRKFSYKFVYVQDNRKAANGCRFYVTRFSDGQIKIKATSIKNMKCVVTPKHELKIIAPSSPS